MYTPLNPTPCMHWYWKQKTNFTLNSTNLKIHLWKLLFFPDPPYGSNLKTAQFPNHIHRPWPISQILLSRINISWQSQPYTTTSVTPSLPLPPHWNPWQSWRSLRLIPFQLSTKATAKWGLHSSQLLCRRLTHIEILDRAGDHSDRSLSSAIHKPQAIETFVFLNYFMIPV